MSIQNTYAELHAVLNAKQGQSGLCRPLPCPFTFNKEREQTIHMAVNAMKMLVEQKSLEAVLDEWV